MLMRTKLALSLVSRTIHALCARMLYEVVSVYDPRRILPLVATLRRTCRFASQPHGWFCRRLDVDLFYNMPDWNHGAGSLWGLLLACPNLEILNISLNAQGPGVVTTPVRGMFNCPLSLIIQIVELYGARLRRFELRGDVCVYFSAIQYLAARCPRLEILCVPGMFAARHEISEEHPNEVDAPDSIVLMNAEQVAEASAAMVDDENSHFLFAHRQAQQWRTLCYDVPHLTALHTLDVGSFANRTVLWQLPSLKVLHFSYRDFLVCRGDRSYIDEAEVHAEVLAKIGRQLRAWTYSGGYVDVFAQLEKLPDLEYLAFDMVDEPESAGAHDKLRELDILVEANDVLWIWVQFIFDLAVEGAFPSLRTIRILDQDESDFETGAFSQFITDFARLGIALVTATGELQSGPTVFHVPALLTQKSDWMPSNWKMRNTVKYFAKTYPEFVQRMVTYREWSERQKSKHH
ncbi:hypothetical protein AURDEDRAFT_110509 [Auricularia subglabra TFB-10046 SS5]|nr:hypothetical protein AURDEDRAFT_110509 [Auricularia subglabra TFB-10046 SS5]